MSTYDDYDRRRPRADRPPYPPDPQDDYSDRRSRPTKADAGPPPSEAAHGKSDIPPPPLGSAMKREGSRSRAANLKPEFPDEASYLNGRSPDLERKTDDRDRRFRERRDGYGNDEGEALRGDMRRQRSQRDPRPRGDYEGRSGPPSESTLPVRGGPPRDNRRDDDDYVRRDDRDRDSRRPPRDYDDRPRRRDYDDDDPPSRRRGPRSGVEYGAEPVKTSRRGDTDRRDGYARRDRYDDDDSADDRRRRRRSQPAPRRGGRSDDDDYYDRDSRRHRDDDRSDRRRPERRRSHDEYDDDYYDRKRRDRRDDRDDRDRRDRRDDRSDRDRRDRRDDKRREPTHMKVGNVDLGPAIDKGQKYYGTLAPILTPIVMNYLKNKK